VTSMRSFGSQIDLLSIPIVWMEVGRSVRIKQEPVGHPPDRWRSAPGSVSAAARHGAARARLKGIVEGPDPALDRIIRSVRESRGTIIGKLRAEYPTLERAGIAEDVVRAIREEFPWTAIDEG